MTPPDCCSGRWRGALLQQIPIRRTTAQPGHSRRKFGGSEGASTRDLLPDTQARERAASEVPHFHRQVTIRCSAENS